MLFIAEWTVIPVCNFYCEEIDFQDLSLFPYPSIHKNLFVLMLAENRCS